MFGFVYLTRFSHFIIHVECAVSEWPKACQAVRLGFRRDGDKEMSQPKTEAMRMRKSIGKTVSTEAEYRKELAEQCEFCGKGFDSAQGLHRHQTGICPADGLPWCTAAAWW